MCQLGGIIKRSELDLRTGTAVVFYKGTEACTVDASCQQRFCPCHESRLINKISRISQKLTTVCEHELDHLVINSTTAMAAKDRVKPVLLATAVVEFIQVVEFVSAYGTTLFEFKVRFPLPWFWINLYQPKILSKGKPT